MDNAKQALEAIPEKKVTLSLQPTKRNVNLDVKEYLESVYGFRYNTVMQMVEFTDGKSPWKFFQARDFDKIYSKLMIADIRIAKDVLKAVIQGELAQDFNPFNDYILSLPKWDGKEYINDFLSMVVLDEAESRESFENNFTKWMVALVAGLIDDKVVNHQCFVIQGEQGIFKTTWLNSIVPEHLRDDYLYSQPFDFHNKDHQKYLGQKMLINLDEMSSYDRADMNQLKSALTSPTVTLRQAYAAFDSCWTRRASFCGSINQQYFLADETGNRRFIVHKVKGINFRQFDVSALYAQAYALFKAGFRFWFNGEDIKKIEEQNDNFRKVSIEEDLITQWLSIPDPSDMFYTDFMTVTEINQLLLEKLGGKVNMNEVTTKRIGMIMNKLGFESSVKWIPGIKKHARGYKVMKNQSAYVRRTDETITTF
ncbi:MAG: virulence-associated E family protein [Bacteroidetes bacterium]|nr:virulence-associated E family protein [Bacteroidota bacterium]